MQYVQLDIITPTPIDPKKSGEIGNVAKISPIKKVGAGEVTISQPEIASPSATSEPGPAEHVLQIRDELDRRKNCRRITNLHVLEELRSQVRRRHESRRQLDITTVIDELA